VTILLFLACFARGADIVAGFSRAAGHDVVWAAGRGDDGRGAELDAGAPVSAAGTVWRVRRADEAAWFAHPSV
jgi:hypothetical protein